MTMMVTNQMLLVLLIAVVQVTTCFIVLPSAPVNNNNRKIWRSSSASASDADAPPDQDNLLEQISSSTLPDNVVAKLEMLSQLVDEWNEKINLVSRKDCSPEVVMERHILPSIAPILLLNDDDDTTTVNGVQRLLQQQPQSKQVEEEEDSSSSNRPLVIDVGCGGGFPGLPLAIVCPELDFVLLDSVGKKLLAVEAMADELGLQNVRTHHGRAEEYSPTSDDDQQHQLFDLATGRSVSAIVDFCAVMKHLLKKDSGQLMYWTGGSIDDSILQQSIDDLIIKEGDDKRVLTFPQTAVVNLAKQSTKLKQLRVSSSSTSNRKSSSSSNNKKSKRRKHSKGEWKKKKSDDEPKQRGYENFQRYSSSTGTTCSE